MNKKAFIFTMDAALTLLPLFIALASLSSIGGIDTTGSLHHLVMERRAQDILAVQEINGTLVDVSTYYQKGVNTSNQTIIDQATSLLSGIMNDTVPSYYGYNATMVTPFGNLSVSRGNPTDNLAVSVRSVVGPKLGWMGKALYKNDSVVFQNISVDVVRNVFNFDKDLHNDNNYGNASFYLPNDVTVNDCWYGAETHMSESNSPSGTIPPADLNENLSTSYQFTPYINGNQAADTTNGSEFKYIGYWSDGGYGDAPFYATDRDGDGMLWCDSSLIQPGLNNFTWSDNNANYWQNSMTLLVNFTTQILMPRFMQHQIVYLPDSAGNAQTSICSPLPDDPGQYNSSSCNNTWASVIWSEKTINIPSGTYVKDATLHLNIGGAADATVVYVQNSSGWTKIFDSDADFWGWSNRVMPPSVLDLRESITTGDNTIKVLLWDSAETQASYEYEIIKNSYIELLTTDKPLRLGVFNAENTNNTGQTFTFTVEADATKAYFYPGVSISASHIEVWLDNTTDSWPVYDDDPLPEYVDLSPYINLTEEYLRPGTYTISVTIDKFTRGQMTYNGIFSGTRVLVTYSQIFGYEWTDSYTESQETAEEEARRSLSSTLATVGEDIPWNSSEIQASSAYASAYPVTSYMVLTIWGED